MTRGYFRPRRGRRLVGALLAYAKSLLIVLALAVVPASQAGSLSDVPADPLPLPSVDDEAFPVASAEPAVSAVDLGTIRSFSGVCVGAHSPGMDDLEGRQTTESDEAPVFVDTDPDGSTSVDGSGDASQGLDAQACVVPCMPVMPMPPYYRPTCLQEWMAYICSGSCKPVEDIVRDLVCCQTAQVSLQ